MRFSEWTLSTNLLNVWECLISQIDFLQNVSLLSLLQKNQLPVLITEFFCRPSLYGLKSAFPSSLTGNSDPKLFGDYMAPGLLAFLPASFFLVFNFTRSGPVLFQQWIGSLKIEMRIRIRNAPTFPRKSTAPWLGCNLIGWLSCTAQLSVGKYCHFKKYILVT